VTLYEVYATRWDNPHIVDELIPARNLQFSMPRCDHGEAHFDATVEPGWSSWRGSLTKDLSGVLITRDGVPIWQGWVVDDQETGPRTFSFRAIEWGYYFTLTPAIAHNYVQQNDCLIFRDMIDRAQAVTGQNVAVQTGTALGSSVSDKTINAWDNTTVEREFRAVADAEGGPEWYFGTTGTLDNPVRQLYLADRLGTTDPAAFLEFVEDTAPVVGPDGPPTVQLLGSLFPGVQPQVPTRRAGGNVIAKARTRQGDSATVAVATNTEPQAAQKQQTATSTLIGRGWPAMTRLNSYSNVTDNTTLLRHANADLAKAQGFTTGYSLATLDGDPDWTQVPRGSTVTVSLDTDVYAGPRPLEFGVRLLNVTVRVPDAGLAQVQWDVATVQEV
jgi:hypothetical protein